MRPAGRSFVALPRVVAGIAALAMAPSAHAQHVERQLDAGLVQASLTGLASTTLLFASGSAREVRERWGWSASASVAQGGTGGPSGFGTAGIELAPLATWGWRTTIDATLGGAVGFDGTSSAGHVRQYALLFGAPVWIGGAIGETRRAVATSPNTMLEAGLAWPMGAHVLTLEARQLRTADFPLVEAAGFGLSRAAAAYDFRDVQLAMRLRTAPVELAFVASYRSGYQATTGEGTTFSAAAEFPVAEGLRGTVSLGRVLADVMRGAPDATMAGFSLRWAWPSGHVARSIAPASGSEAMIVRDGTGSTLVLEVRERAEARVELAVSFLDWTPRAMAYEGGRFVARLPLPPGNHRVAVRVNGGRWLAPAGLPRVDDELGGSSGLVIVP